MLYVGPDSLTNSWHLYQMEAELTALPIPPQTQSLTRKSALGILSGNSNHCDFFVGLLFRSSLTPTIIEQHYAGRIFHNPVTSAQEEFQVTILTTPKHFRSKYVWLPDGLGVAEAWGVSTQDFASNTIYLVSFFEQYPTNHDWRCH
jgi:hypothetical protein